MRLKNVLLAVKDLERSKRFYRDVFGLQILLDSACKAIMTEGLVLQEAEGWRECLGREIYAQSHACTLYFEERDLLSFAEKLERLYPDIQYVHRHLEPSLERKVLRFYDLDGHLLEVAGGAG